MSDVIDRGAQFAMVPFPVIEAVQDARALALYVVLRKYANHRTRTAHPSRKRLAEHLGYRSPKPIDEALEVLGSLGLVETFPRFKDSEGNIGYRQDGIFREQTSNGYIIHDIPQPPRGGKTPDPLPSQDTPPIPPGVDPLSPQGYTPYPSRAYKLEPFELDPLELDKEDPLPPPSSGVAPQGAETGEGQQSLAVPEEKPKTRSSRGEYLPEQWFPDQSVITTIQSEFPHLDLESEHADFCDYWHSRSGQIARKRDWNATWRTWMRKQGRQGQGFRRQNAHTAPSRADEKAMGYFAVAEELGRQASAEAGFRGYGNVLEP